MKVYDLTAEQDKADHNDLLEELNHNLIICNALMMNLNATVKH